MKSIFKSIIGVFVFSMMTLQVSAQCENTATATSTFQVFPSDQFGQSFIADAACLGGDYFTEFSFVGNGNQTVDFTLEIFNGQSVAPANLKYTEEGIILPPLNQGGTATIVLGGGTSTSGTLDYVDGNTYTILLTTQSGTIVYHMSGDNVSGQVFTNGAFFSAKDLKTAVAGGANPIVETATGECDHLANGDFENGLTGWTFSSAGLAGTGTFHVSGGNPGGAVELNDNGGGGDPNLSQTLTTEVGVEYTVSGDYKGGIQYFSCPSNGVALEVDADGVELDGFSYDPTATPTYAPFSTTFTATATTTVLTFRGEAHGDCSVIIDNIEVCGAAAPVPTMGEWALVTFGLIIMSMGVITVRRREQDLIVKAA